MGENTWRCGSLHREEELRKEKERGGGEIKSSGEAVAAAWRRNGGSGEGERERKKHLGVRHLDREEELSESGGRDKTKNMGKAAAVWQRRVSGERRGGGGGGETERMGRGRRNGRRKGWHCSNDAVCPRHPQR